MRYITTLATLMLSWGAVSLAWHLYLAYQCECFPESQHTFWGTVAGYYLMAAIAIPLSWRNDE